MQKLINNLFRRQSSPWECIGGRDGRPSHPSFVNHSDWCQICGAPRPEAPKPGGSTDIFLLIALIIFNLGSGFTTIYGALKIFPWLVGITSGAAIQALLFLLVSGSTAKHAPRLKWLAIASLSSISVYTSFFAYYDAIAGRSNEGERIERAKTSHQNLIQEVYNPIEQKAIQLKSDIDTNKKKIEEEIAGRRASGLPGCGDICTELTQKNEKLLAQYNKLQPIVKNLRPLFEYQVDNKSPQEIFNADIKALAKVPKNCLPEDPNFDCFPPKYEGSLDPQNTKYEQLRNKYFDEDITYTIIAPFNKIRKGETPAIFAAVFALMVDGLIIALGRAIEIPDNKKK